MTSVGFIIESNPTRAGESPQGYARAIAAKSKVVWRGETLTEVRDIVERIRDLPKHSGIANTLNDIILEIEALRTLNVPGR